jgi:hypothetical protein
MKKSLVSSTLFLFLLLITTTCSKDFLDVPINRDLSDEVLADAEGIDFLLVGAYSMLDGVFAGMSGDPWMGTSSGWYFGDVRGLIANKGSDAGDQTDNGVPLYRETSKNDYLYTRWRSIYEGIYRCNNTIRVIKLAEGKNAITPQQADLFMGQARSLRGWYHLEAYKMWEKIPFVDEYTGIFDATNKVDCRDKIIADLEAGTNLPDNMGQIGRFNGTVCKVMLAKAYMQMYHNYESALPLLTYAKTSGTRPNGAPVGLAPTYGEIFDIENRNGIEAVYTVQYSVNDGSGGYNGGAGEVLNFPYSNHGPAGCCGFFQPNQEFVNSFRTHVGLPLLDFSYNNDPVVSDMGIASTDTNFVEDSGALDPRLDWSVGRRGIPYWDWGIHEGSSWIRSQEFAGPYSPKKQVYKKSQEGIYTETGNWTTGYTANGYRLIRFADVLLLLAECQIETGDLDGALENINAVRARAANPDGFVKESDGVTPAANYQVSLYPSFPDADYARKALYMECKLEFGMEGHRYFDLNRWGITVNELNRILTYQRTLPNGNMLYGSAVVGPEDITYPIPKRDIELSQGNLVQNRVEEEE